MGFQEKIRRWVGRPVGFPMEEDIDTTLGVWSIPPHPRRDMEGRIIPRGEAEFRQHSEGGFSPDTREEESDDTEVNETDPPGEPERYKRTSMVETPEDVDVPEEPETWNSGSERGEDQEFEPDEGEDEGQDTGDEERMKNMGGAYTTGTVGDIAVVYQSEVARYTREVADD